MNAHRMPLFDDVLILNVAWLNAYGRAYWSYNTVRVKLETSALRLVPCFARAGHMMCWLLKFSFRTDTFTCL